MNLDIIIKTLDEYRVVPEYQYVEYSIEPEKKLIFQSIPYRAETTMRAIWGITYPEIKDNDLIIKLSNEYLKNNPEVRKYIDNYLDNELKNLK